MGRHVFRTIRHWLYMVALVLVIAAVGRDAQSNFIDGVPYQQIGHSFWNVLAAVFKAPIQLFTPAYYKFDISLLSHAPISLFYIVYAFVGSFLFGVLKGIADVFWQRRILYRGFQGLFWLLDAIPMFGLIVILECGTLYAAMTFPGDPFKMLPNQTFWLGDLIRANLLMWAPMMYISRITGISIAFELGEDYLLTARSKGMERNRLFRRHVFANIVPKLQNEVTTVFVMIMSSLVALEYLSFQDQGFMFKLLAGMGQGELGQTTLYIDEGHFFVQTVVGYLLILAVFTGVFHLLAGFIKRRWREGHNYE
ncbi:ABC transporter permease subunit [Alicyclobacillus curvatus]|nr:ABC transporter permease subunit [Alicyclobacillus curvatus]